MIKDRFFLKEKKIQRNGFFKKSLKLSECTLNTHITKKTQNIKRYIRFYGIAINDIIILLLQ